MMWELLEIGVPGALAVLYWRRSALARAYWLRERRLREELEEYACLDVSLRGGSGADGRGDRMVAGKGLARRVCRAIADKSAFTRVLLLVRSPEGRFVCMGSSGVDDLTVASVEAWGEQVTAEDRGGEGNRSGTMGGRTAAAHVPISLGEWARFDPEISSWAMSGRRERRRWRRAIAVPIRTVGRAGPAAARMAGAIVVCTDGLTERAQDAAGHVTIERLLDPVGTLAARIATALEAEALCERLARAEKLAGLGQLAGGVSDALNEPLTAVLGFAELIAEGAAEPRVQEDARKITAEARRMQETVERLGEFWRPGVNADEPVRLDVLAREVTEAWTGELKGLNARLELHVQGEPAPVRGSGERLRELIDLLLQHALTAVGVAAPMAEGEEHLVRISLAEDEQRVHLIVSHTGQSFAEPGRVFDPLHATRETLERSGLGLSLCFGIVREHGGDVSAFNQHPRGATVVVELPRGLDEPAARTVKRLVGSAVVRADAQG